MIAANGGPSMSVSSATQTNGHGRDVLVQGHATNTHRGRQAIHPTSSQPETSERPRSAASSPAGADLRPEPPSGPDNRGGTRKARDGHRLTRTIIAARVWTMFGKKKTGSETMVRSQEQHMDGAESCGGELPERVCAVRQLRQGDRGLRAPFFAGRQLGPSPRVGRLGLALRIKTGSQPVRRRTVTRTLCLLLASSRLWFTRFSLKCYPRYGWDPGPWPGG